MNNSSSFNYSAAFPSLNMMSGINQLGGSDNIAIPDNPYKSIMERMKENREDDSRYTQSFYVLIGAIACKVFRHRLIETREMYIDT